MAMAGVVLAAVVAAAGVGGYALHTWRSVQIRRCECSETIARIRWQPTLHPNGKIQRNRRTRWTYAGLWASAIAPQAAHRPAL